MAFDLRTVVPPPGPVDPDEARQAHHSMITGDPLPAGWQLSPDKTGTVRITLTGLIHAVNGKKQAVVSIEEDSHAQLVQATVAIDGSVKKTATPENGMIEYFSGGVAIATIPLWLPADYPYAAEVRWQGDQAEEWAYTFDLQ